MMNKRNNREYSGKVLIGEDCTMDEYNADTCPYAYTYERLCARRDRLTPPDKYNYV